MSETITAKIITFIGEYTRTKDISIDHDLFASGMANSLLAMQLVLFIEKEFQIKIENHDLNIDNFRTINAIVGLIESKLDQVQLAVG